VRRVVVCLVGVLLVAVAAAGLQSERRLSGRSGPLEAAALRVAPHEVSRERGRHLVESVVQCRTCHGPDLGGALVADDPWVGRLWAPNLTTGRGGVGRTALLLGMRHGVNRRGQTLWAMPSRPLARLPDADLASIMAYLESLPPVDRMVPGRRAGPLTRLYVLLSPALDLLSARAIAQPTGAARAPRAEPLATRGARLAELASCTLCHHADLRGGLHALALPGEPPPPDLTGTGRLASWSRADFARALRTGRTPDGRVLDARFMPWPGYGGLSDAEVGAIWELLVTRGAGSARVPLQASRR